ncbi:MAG: nucleotide exchange factor GrpE [Bacteroidota bacterium]
MEKTTVQDQSRDAVTDGELTQETPMTSGNMAAAGEIPEIAPDEQYSVLNDKYLRLYSDFDNYRKRTLKEKIELNKSASAEVIIRLLPVLDDFERALKAFETTNESGQALKDGVVLIYNKFLATLTQQGLERMRVTGEKFDTDFHEAITNIPASTPEQKGKIVDEIERGYLLNGKVIRFAKVVVGS